MYYRFHIDSLKLTKYKFIVQGSLIYRVELTFF